MWRWSWEASLFTSLCTLWDNSQREVRRQKAEKSEKTKSREKWEDKSYGSLLSVHFFLFGRQTVSNEKRQRVDQDPCYAGGKNKFEYFFSCAKDAAKGNAKGSLPPSRAIWAKFGFFDFFQNFTGAPNPNKQTDRKTDTSHIYIYIDLIKFRQCFRLIFLGGNRVPALAGSSCPAGCAGRSWRGRRGPARTRTPAWAGPTYEKIDFPQVL